MNRKSSAVAFRKSIRPRESQAPGSAGAPPSARRGFGNRTILDTTRSSIGGGRPSLYQSNQPKKDNRVFNDEFVQQTFRKLKEFLIEKNMNAEIPNSPKLTLKQFESLFVLLIRFIDPKYKPPTNSNWAEIEVPQLMDALGYPQKVMKSTMQTVSSKAGPIMGILDYLIDLAPIETISQSTAFSYLLTDDAELEIEEFCRNSYMKLGNSASADDGLIVQAEEFCARTKGITGVDQLRDEVERKKVLNRETEAEIDLLEDQRSDLENAEAEFDDFQKYLDQMTPRLNSKQEEVNRISNEITALRQRIAETENQTSQTSKVISSQPISEDEIRKMRKGMKELDLKQMNLHQRTQHLNVDIEKHNDAIRVLANEIASVCEDSMKQLPSMLANQSKDEIVKLVEDLRSYERLMSEVNERIENKNREIAASKEQNQRQSAEFRLAFSGTQNSIERAKQDLQALEEKETFFKARCDKRNQKVMDLRADVIALKTKKTFTEKEVMDLQLALESVQNSLTAAKEVLVKEHVNREETELVTSKFEKRIDDVIAVDQKRMRELVDYYNACKQAYPVREVLSTITKLINNPIMQECFETTERLTEQECFDI